MPVFEIVPASNYASSYCVFIPLISLKVFMRRKQKHTNKNIHIYAGVLCLHHSFNNSFLILSMALNCYTITKFHFLLFKAKKTNTKWYTNFLECIQEQARKRIQSNRKLITRYKTCKSCIWQCCKGKKNCFQIHGLIFYL